MVSKAAGNAFVELTDAADKTFRYFRAIIYLNETTMSIAPHVADYFDFTVVNEKSTELLNAFDEHLSSHGHLTASHNRAMSPLYQKHLDSSQRLLKASKTF